MFGKSPVKTFGPGILFFFRGFFNYWFSFVTSKKVSLIKEWFSYHLFFSSSNVFYWQPALGFGSEKFNLSEANFHVSYKKGNFNAYISLVFCREKKEKLIHMEPKLFAPSKKGGLG